MNNLKFRAWHKDTEKFLKIIFINFADENIQVVYGGYRTILPIEDVEIMQSTGLKDKNGKEIFEGDVVEYLDASGLANEDVGINHGIVELDLREGIHFTNRSSVEMEDVDFDSDVEIIGNIYENPELLNK